MYNIFLLIFLDTMDGLYVLEYQPNKKKMWMVIYSFFYFSTKKKPLYFLQTFDTRPCDLPKHIIHLIVEKNYSSMLKIKLNLMHF